MTSYDHLIIGTGQATGTLLGRLIPTGDAIAVVEGAQVGGSCVNYGCTPTKTLVASARALHLARRGDDFGFRTGPVVVDYARVRERMNAIRHGASDGLTRWMENTDNVTLLHGWAAFEDDHTVRVGDTRIQSKNVYLNVGTRPLVPPIEGLDAVPWLDSARLLDLEAVPEHLVVIGGGYIGLEFAQVFRRFGAAVTVIQWDDQLMPQEDADVAEAIQEILAAEGIRIYCSARAVRAAETATGVRVDVEYEGRTLAVEGSHLLVAVGRRPNSDTLSLENTSIETNGQGFIAVDDVCRTAAEGVFALGDVNGHGAFTHTSVHDAEVVLDHLFGGPRRLSSRVPVYALFTDPPLGRVGLTEKDALAAGKHVLKATRPMKRISRAKEMAETQGFAKLLVDADTDQLLGASILGPRGDEVINLFAVLIHQGISWKDYRQVVHVHPTISELMPWTLDDLKPVG